MLLVGAICFEDRSSKGGTGGGGWVHRSGLQCIAAVAAACRKALVDAGWAICLQREVKGCFFHFAQALNRKISTIGLLLFISYAKHVAPFFMSH